MSTKEKTELTDFELKALAMKLAIQHQKGCQLSTLIKIANGIYNFLTNKPQEKES